MDKERDNTPIIHFVNGSRMTLLNAIEEALKNKRNENYQIKIDIEDDNKDE